MLEPSSWYAEWYAEWYAQRCFKILWEIALCFTYHILEPCFLADWGSSRVCCFIVADVFITSVFLIIFLAIYTLNFRVCSFGGLGISIIAFKLYGKFRTVLPSPFLEPCFLADWGSSRVCFIADAFIDSVFLTFLATYALNSRVFFWRIGDQHNYIDSVKLSSNILPCMR